MIRYDPSLDDDAWREANFSTTQLASAYQTNAKQPTAKELIKAAEKYGTEGILESAILLTQKEFKKVADALRQMK